MTISSTKIGYVKYMNTSLIDYFHRIEPIIKQLVSYSAPKNEFYIEHMFKDVSGTYRVDLNADESESSFILVKIVADTTHPVLKIICSDLQNSYAFGTNSNIFKLNLKHGFTAFMFRNDNFDEQKISYHDSTIYSYEYNYPISEEKLFQDSTTQDVPPMDCILQVQELRDRFMYLIPDEYYMRIVRTAEIPDALLERVLLICKNLDIQSKL